MTRRCLTVFAALAGFVALLGAAPLARAYDPATTHAGLTERAVLASSLHKVLAHRLARPLGLFEPLRLRAGDLQADEARDLFGRLGALDPAGGYRPSDEGAASAISWIVAGAVIAKTPSDRGRNFFYDPSTGSGLTGAGDGVAFTHGVRRLVDGGTFRAVATGTDFNLTGMPATAWLVAPENDVGLVVFHRELERSVSAADPGERGTALARALLALGGTLAIVQDAGEPAHVRNDFVGAYLDQGVGRESPFDRASAFERYVSERYGRVGVPNAGAAVTRPTVAAVLTASDGLGLADRTQRRFFSAGTVPEDAIVDRETSAADVIRDARASLRYGLPRLPRLELASIGKKRYAYAGTRRLVGYERVAGRVRFFLDDTIYADTARALLPEIGAYGAGLCDHLFRAELTIAAGADGEGVTVEVRDARGGVEGEVKLFAEDARGRRSALGAAKLSGGATSVSVAGRVPEGTRRLAAVLHGKDEAGELIAVGQGAPRP
jgi:hypothetical protein